MDCSKQKNKVFVAVFVLVMLATLFFVGKAVSRVTVPSTTPTSTVFVPDQKDITLVAVGDNMLSRVVAQRIQAMKSVDYPFVHLSDFLHTGDIVFGNLETAISPGKPVGSGGMLFRSDPAVAPALKRAGFTIISLANNHSPNYGQKGLKDTFHYLSEAGVAFVGAGEDGEAANAPKFMRVKDKTFAFLAYNDSDVVPPSYEAGKNHAGTAFMRLDRLKSAVVAAKKQADFVIVSMHSGTEYSLQPNASQTRFAHAAIDAGAELVLGHHPHTIQPVEQYKGKYILYSLGNFVFDQMWSRATRESVAVKIYFNETGVYGLDFYPLLIENYAQPRFLLPSEPTDVWRRLHNPLLVPRVERRFASSSQQFVDYPVRALR